MMARVTSRRAGLWNAHHHSTHPTYPPHCSWHSRVRLDTPQSTHSPLLHLQPSSPTGSAAILQTPASTQLPSHQSTSPKDTQPLITHTNVPTRTSSGLAVAIAQPGLSPLLPGWRCSPAGALAHTVCTWGTAACLHTELHTLQTSLGPPEMFPKALSSLTAFWGLIERVKEA